MSLKEITLEEAFSLGEGESYHLYIQDPKLVITSLVTLETRGALWRSGNKPTDASYLLEDRKYPIVLTVSNVHEGSPRISIASVDGIDNIQSYWSIFPSRGVVIVDKLTEKLKIKRKDKI